MRKNRIFVRIYLQVLISLFMFSGYTIKAAGIFNPDSSIYYVTNRIDISTGDTISFGNIIDPNHKLSFGKINRDEGNIQTKEYLNLDSIYADIPETKNILVFVHGAGKTFETALDRAFQTRDIYNVAIIVFTYPTHDPNLKPGDDLDMAIQNADSSSNDFKRFLVECARLSIRDKNNSNNNGYRHTSLLFHSLGNYLLERCFEGTINDFFYDDYYKRPFENLLMVAAAVDSRQHASWMPSMAIMKNLYVISNKHDITLMGAKLFTSWHLQLGQKVKGKKVQWAEYYDFKRILGFTFNRAPSHSYFYGIVPKNNKVVWSFFNEAFNGRNPNACSDCLILYKNRTKMYYLTEMK